MSGIEILAALAVVAFMIFKQVKGELLQGKRTVLLPLILTAIGYSDLHDSAAHFSHADLVCLAVSLGSSILVGLAFGAVTRLRDRDGYLWAQLPVGGLWLWGAMIVSRVAVFALGSALHSHVATSSLLLSLGLNRLAQAAVIAPRAMAMGVTFAPEKDGKVFLAEAFNRGTGYVGSTRQDGAAGYDRGAQFSPNAQFNAGAEDARWAEFDRVAAGSEDYRRQSAPAGRR
jgi:hypothetical protein